ncbi:hypothetical protein [Microbacterium schleiferi]|jgi:type II secretory pathway pseudopilin PulG|uniref:Uncharacterized protein n=1 Tax=Microbacterium schleiferi TaxID=69362 RepID=A0ABU7V3Y1_9MICO|nr:hypothetical protein [Micrococcales bacterium]
MEYFAYSFWFWIAIIVVAGIAAGVITNLVNKSNETKRYLADRQARGGAATATDQEVLSRLESIEQRLASIETHLKQSP